VERKVQQAREFFTDANIKKLALLATQPDDVDRLASVGWDETQGIVVGAVLPERRVPDPQTMLTSRVVNMDRYGRAPPGGWPKRRKKGKRR
jgi:hypothetical protein